MTEVGHRSPIGLYNLLGLYDIFAKLVEVCDGGQRRRCGMRNEE